MNTFTPELLINASRVIHRGYGDIYEFVLNEDLSVVECVSVASPLQGGVTSIPNPQEALEGMLFHFNHVRVNPRVDNTNIIQRFRKELTKAGIVIKDRQTFGSYALPLKIIGELTSELRFHLPVNDNQLVFLSPDGKPRLASIRP